MTTEEAPDDIELEALKALRRIAEALEGLHSLAVASVHERAPFTVEVSGHVYTEDAGA
jgi:hypothetical protein